jgi:uncharacterized Rossmann fold enzyme
MARFKKGNQILCIKKGVWHNQNGMPTKYPYPKFNDVVTYDGTCDGDRDFIYLAEYFRTRKHSSSIYQTSPNSKRY